MLKREAKGSGSGQRGKGGGLSRIPEGAPTVLAGLGMALAVAKAYREPPGVSMPPDAMEGARGRGQVQDSPGLPEEEAGGSQRTAGATGFAS